MRAANGACLFSLLTEVLCCKRVKGSFIRGKQLGIFSDNVRKYFEFGLVTIPCKDKRPILGSGWQEFCQVAPTSAMIDKWEKSYQDVSQLGLTMGPSTLLSGFDFDYEWLEKKCALKKPEFDKDRRMIERQILALLPPTPAIKMGRKGWTRLYKSHGELDNAQCDRNGVRLFDFLARNKQTIIPPSKYSDDTDFSYRWLGPPIEECLDDIPFITSDIVAEIKMLFGDGAAFDFTASGRHGVLFRWLLDVVRLESDDLVLASKLVARDIGLNKVPYLSDPKHFARFRSPDLNALEWIKRVRKFVGVARGLPVGGGGWDFFFDNSFSSIRKDVISKKCFFKLNPGSDWGLMDEVEGVLRSYADRKGLPQSKTVDELARWTLEKVDADFLCDIPKWDGVDRVALFGSAVKSPNFSGNEIAEILRHWGSNIFRRVKSADFQNRCVIFKGPQGMGKDFFVRAMLRDFKPYYESTTMPGTQKDALEICSRLLAVHIEEFDQTKHMDMAFMKSLITQPSAFFRESYGSSPNQKIMRPSFISTANVDDILRDPTGNRRFIVIPTEGLDWTYPTDSSLQVLAQWRSYFETGEWVTLSDELEAKIKVIIDSFTPEDLSVAIVELYCERFLAMISPNGPRPGAFYLTGQEVVSMLMDISKKAQCSLRKVQSSIKGSHRSHKFRDGTRYFKNSDDMEKMLAGVKSL